MPVRAVLSKLSTADQEALRLTEWEQLSIDEAAQVLGVSRTAFKVRLHRARRRLAARLTSESATDEAHRPDRDHLLQPALKGNTTS
jgi:RNA polymerase sigma-70 factor (ECF subfamily)